jgi:hypothetical protein
MRPSDLDRTVQIRRVLDICGARRHEGRKERRGGLPVVNGDSVACRRGDGGVTRLVVVQAASRRCCSSLLGVAFVTDGVGASRVAAFCGVPGEEKKGAGSGDAGGGVGEGDQGRGVAMAP